MPRFPFPGPDRMIRAGATALALCGLSVGLGACGGQSAAPGTTAQMAASATAVVAGSGHARAYRIRYARVPLKVPAGNGGHGLDGSRTLILPRGWSAEVWARVPAARLETWTPEGNLLVSQPGNGTVSELLAARTRSDPPRVRTLLSGLSSPQGLAFDRLNGQEVLYVAENDRIDRYVWRGDGVGARTILVSGLPSTGAHPLKNVVVGRDHTVYFDVGSASNADAPAHTNPPRASVLAYRPDGRRRRVLATGVRNGDGLSFAPDGSLWAAVNERDDIAYPFRQRYGGGGDAYGEVIPAYVANHPPDEIARLTPGRNLGWPFCDPDPDVSRGRAGTALHYGNMAFDADFQANSGGHVLNCSKLARVQRGIPAHSAPLGFHFLQHSALPAPWSNGAVVVGHGSWDRVPPRAPAVLWMPWKARGRTLGSAVDLVAGFQDADGTRWGRTVDAVPGPDGALYVSDDTAGAIYRIVPTKGF
ncbi:MAG: hypothetical protein WAK93_09770 [Solirubrobacteraceae bacterium]